MEKRNVFTLNGVTLRALELDDIEILHSWESDIELSILGGWTPFLSKVAFRHRFEKRITEPENDLKYLGIEHEEQLVGYMQLKLERHERRAYFGLVVGVKDLWGRGIGSTAVRILLDYAFTVYGLERICAEVFSFNQRSRHMMEKVGFQQEGLLRQHEIHNGVRQDMYTFGILKHEFYQRYETIFKLA